jgi:peptide deformylase
METVKEPNKILHDKLTEVKEITPEILELIAGMRKTMKESNGIGLAANQVGKKWQIFVIDENLAKENNVPDAYINPEITQTSKEQTEIEEGCLSIPEYWQNVKRSKKVMLKALDQNGKKIKIKARGLLARVFQHEVDHLNGLLIKDY